ncbi:hypothetical protein B0H19DRAFT_657918 [Mycena capillaripes]|nr:hypothetical protein B0H19DRAFT_657918 [Mycena capillaripes]
MSQSDPPGPHRAHPSRSSRTASNGSRRHLPDPSDTYTLTCGASSRITVDPTVPYPRSSPKKYAASMLPLPLDEESSQPRTEDHTNGCGTTLHVSARGNYRHKTWFGEGDSVHRTVVLLPAEYFTEVQKRELGGVPRKAECGCLTVGVGCCICGNTLGTLTTRCEVHMMDSSYPTFYTFLGAAVSPPIPIRAPRRKVPLNPPTTITPPPVMHAATEIQPSTIAADPFNLAEWIRLSESSARAPAWTPTEEERREEELNLQGIADEIAWMEEQADAERAAAVARFYAEEGAPTTQEEMRVWTHNVIRNFAGGVQRSRGREFDR